MSGGAVGLHIRQIHSGGSLQISNLQDVDRQYRTLYHRLLLKHIFSHLQANIKYYVFMYLAYYLLLLYRYCNY